MAVHLQDVRPKPLVSKPTSLQLRAAYAVCRSIARAAAKNFYYGFLALPRYKRNALCALYAFMRQADDISDNPSVSIEGRRQALEDFSAKLHRVLIGKP